MRLELMTYALRKRRRKVANAQPASSYDDRNSVVAPQVALGSPENACDVVTLPDDLGEVVRLWPGLSEDVRKAVLTIIRQSAGS